MNLSAVILAGGKSTRMGRDKARLEIGGRPLLARQIQLVRETGTGEVFVSGRAGEDYLDFDCVVLSDRFGEAGPIAGIERALAAASSSRLLVVAVDMPGLTPVILKRLVERGGGTKGIIPRIDGRTEPLAAIYPKLAGKLAESLLGTGIYSARTFADRCVQNGLADFFDLDASMACHFVNWNEPADLRSAVA
jgi:molybdopterin-guanine dinucleotide biosynthesis protein A